MSPERDLQEGRKLLESYNRLDNATREKLANGVECLAFLQNMARMQENDITITEPAKAAV